MSRFHGRQGAGALRAHKAVLRDEANERNARTPEHRRKAFLYGPVTVDGVRTARSVGRYVTQFIEDHGSAPFDMRDEIEAY